jgi:chlorobactene glucosyltransferase
MLAVLSGAVCLGLVLYLLSRILRQFRAHRATTLPRISEPRGQAVVSIIIPVRNEIDNVATCISGVAAQTGLAPGSSITFVDDGSDDGTAAVIRRQVDKGRPFDLITAGSLPEGWVGKSHACWAGALAAAGGWLCFIDADVRVDAKLVAAAVDAAEIQQIDMLSLHPFQQLGSFWERLLIPAGLLLIACAKSLGAADSPSSPTIDANGQFLLIRREVYFAVGGHAAIGSEICEDRALARRVLEAGFRFRALAAEHLASVRMYRDLGSLWEGLAKNAGEILGSGSETLVVAIAGMFVGAAAPLAPIILAVMLFASASEADLIGFGLMLIGSAVVLGVQLQTALHFRIPAIYGLLMPLGYIAAALLVCNSLLRHLRGRVVWKGRRYRRHRNPSEARF